MRQTIDPPAFERAPSVLAGQLARLGWSETGIQRFERKLEANRYAQDLKANLRRREAELVRFYFFLLAQRSEAEPWKARARRRQEREL